jgi:PAS domain S-box-containing protein
MIRFLVFFFLLTLHFLFAKQNDINTIIQMTKQQVFELNIKELKNTLAPYLKEKPYIKRLVINDSLTNEILLGIEQTNSTQTFLSKIPFQCPKDLHEIVGDIEYQGDIIGKLLLCTAPYNQYSNFLNLTQKEKNWLKHHQTITVHNEKNWAPINFNNNGIPTGFSIELMNTLAKKIGIKVKYITAEWNDLYNMALNKKLDVILNIAINDERRKYFLFSEPYLTNITSIFAKKSDQSVFTIKSLFGKKVAVVDGFFHENYLRQNFPLIQIITKKNTKECLQSVCNGEADATIGSFLVNKHIMSEIACKNLEFKNELQIKTDLRIAVRNDYPEFYSILKKAMAGIGSNELIKLKRKWISFGEEKQHIALTKEEQTWISQNRIINVAGELDWAPFDFVDETNTYTGLTKDYLDLISSLTGLQFKIHTGQTWDQLLKSFKTGKYDILPALYYSKYRSKFMDFTTPYLSISDYFITKKDYKKINNITDLYGKKVAVVKGYEVTQWLKKNHPKVKLIEYDTLLKVLRSIESGITVATIQDNPSTTYVMEKNFITKLKMNNIVKSRNPTTIHMGIQKNNTTLKNILNKALSSISWEDKKKISKRWMSEIKDSPVSLNFTSQEIAWLLKHPKIKFAVDPQWLPIEAIDKQNAKYKGMMADYLKKIQEMTGIEFELIPTKVWSDSVQLIRSKKVDMLTAASITPERQKFLNFSNTTLTLTDGVIMRSDEKFISNLSDLKGKKVGVPQGTSLHNMLKTTYPELILIPIKGTLNGIKSLEKGDIDAYVGNLEVSTYLILAENILNLKIVLKLDSHRELHIALHKDFPKVGLSIINKAINAISDEELNLIRQKWIGLKVNDDINYTLIFKVVIIILIIFLILAFYNRKLKKTVELKTKDIREQKQELENLLAQFDKNVIFSKTDLDGNIIHISEAFCKISGYEYDELIGKSHSIMKHPDTPKETFRLLWEALQKETCIVLELKNKKKNGDTYWIKAKYQPDYDKHNKLVGYSSLIVDITDKKAVEDLSKSLENKVIERTKELENERRYINSIMNSQENIVVSTDGIHIRTANRAFFRFFKVKSLEEFAKSYGSCIGDTFDSCNSDEFIQTITNGIHWAEYILQNSNQFNKVKITLEKKPYIFTVSVDTFQHNDTILKVAVFSDITELENIKNNIESILTTISLPLLITSKKDKKIIYANKYAAEQYEKPIENIIGNNIDTIYTGKGQKKEIFQELNKNGKIENFEEIFITHTGKKFIALLTVTPIVYENEDAYIGMIVDITKQKDIEEEIRQIHKHTKDSIEYASLIQHSLIPESELLRKYFSDYLTIWYPKDIIGGDIYLFDELRDDNECLLMVIDCTGHGVPGAFVTMLVKAIERQITSQLSHSKEIISPAKILGIFNRSMKYLLKQEDKNSISNAGFDGAVLYYNKKEKVIKYAGAEIPLFYIDENKKLQTIKGSRHSVGYKKSDVNYQFQEHILNVTEGMQFYITTDGYIDQNGGEKGFPFGKRRFKSLIEQYKDETFAKQEKILIDTLTEYQKDEDRNDDITIVGIKIGNN